MGNKDKKNKNKKKSDEDNSKEIHLNIDSSKKEIEDDIPTLKNKNNNRFAFDLDSDSDESEKEEKTVKKTQNPFDFGDDSEEDSEVNETDEELETVLKISTDPLQIKEEKGNIMLQNDVKEKAISEIQDNNSDKNNKKNKQNKQNKKENKQNKKLEKNKDRNNINLRTYYSDNIEIDINGKKIICESNIVINSNTKYFVMGYNGCGKTTLLKYIYNKLKDNLDILMIDQDIEIESN